MHDRTGVPLVDFPIEMAARWAVHAGADGLVLTGSTFAQSLDYLRSVRQSGITRPLLLGGGATEDNVAEVLQVADGVIVSSALKRRGAGADDVRLWDGDRVKRFMDAARRARP